MKIFGPLLIILFCIGISLAQRNDSLKGTIIVSNSQKISVSIAGKKGGKISVSELCEFPLETNKPDWRVKSHAVTMVIMGNIIYKHNEGSTLSPEVCTMLYRLKPGNKVFIEDIMVQNESKASSKVGHLSFTINNPKKKKCVFLKIEPVNETP